MAARRRARRRRGGALAAIEPTTRSRLPGTGPLAVGALPFDPAAAGELVVPARVVGELDGRAWVTEIELDAVRRGRPGDRRPPDSRSSAPAIARAVARDGARRALAAIDHGQLEKVVLAREVIVEADTPFDLPRRSCGGSRRSSRAASSTRRDGLVGASPELLVRRIGDDGRVAPVAGTAVADGDDASLRALAASVKDHREHRFVVDAIVDALATCCAELDAGAVPEVAVFGHVAHLATRVRGQLRGAGAERARARPAPAPEPRGRRHAARGRASRPIRALEGFDRGRYAGPVGWVDARGNGEWAIALRGAELDGARARLVAGAGIVAGSDPDAEWAETQAKLEPMLRALVRP